MSLYADGREGNILFLILQITLRSATTKAASPLLTYLAPVVEKIETEKPTPSSPKLTTKYGINFF